MANFMDLSKLAASRAPAPAPPLDTDERELCERYGRTYTGAVNDVLRDSC